MKTATAMMAKEGKSLVDPISVIYGPNVRLPKDFVRQTQLGTWRMTMRSDKDDRNFPAIRLAEAAKIESPTELHRHKLKELSERLDQFHSFTKG